MAQGRRSGPVHTHPSQPLCCLLLVPRIMPHLYVTYAGNVGQYAPTSRGVSRGACARAWRGEGPIGPGFVGGAGRDAGGTAVLREKRVRHRPHDGDWETFGRSSASTTANGRPSVGRVARSGDRATAPERPRRAGHKASGPCSAVIRSLGWTDYDRSCSRAGSRSPSAEGSPPPNPFEHSPTGSETNLPASSNTRDDAGV